MVDAQMTIPQTTEDNVKEAAFFDRIFPNKSGMRFNFEDVREFLHDPLIALIATDLTADENLDNIETILKRIRHEKQEKPSSVQEIMSGIHKILLKKESTQKTGPQETFPGEISSKQTPTTHSIPNLCQDVALGELQKFDTILLHLQHGKKLVWKMLLEYFWTEFLFYTIH